MGVWVGAIQWIVKIHGHTVRSVTFNQVSIDGKTFTIATGGRQQVGKKKLCSNEWK